MPVFSGNLALFASFPLFSHLFVSDGFFFNLKRIQIWKKNLFGVMRVVGVNTMNKCFKWHFILFKENNCAKLFWNTCISIEDMAQTSSIYDHFIIWPSSESLTFDLPKTVFQMALLLLRENTCAKSFWNPCTNVKVMAPTGSLSLLLQYSILIWLDVFLFF